jgi:serine/threonine protein kinase
MSGPPPPELVERLRKHELLTADQLRQFTECQEDLSTPLRVADWLVQKGWFTGFQARHLIEDNLDKLTLAGYRLLEPIGAGGMGEVFRALQLKLNRVVAVKLIRVNSSSSEQSDAIARFRREALAVARLSHPNIVHLYDADVVNGTHFLAM